MLDGIVNQNMIAENRIFDTDTYQEVADKMYHHFVINQSCSVKGFIWIGKRIETIGDMVIKELTRLDKHENMITPRDGRPRRKSVLIPNSVGGFVAQKIFRYKKPEKNDNDQKYTFWRIQ